MKYIPTSIKSKKYEYTFISQQLNRNPEIADRETSEQMKPLFIYFLSGRGRRKDGDIEEKEEVEERLVLPSTSNA